MHTNFEVRVISQRSGEGGGDLCVCVCVYVHVCVEGRGYLGVFPLQDPR